MMDNRRSGGRSPRRVNPLFAAVVASFAAGCLTGSADAVPTLVAADFAATSLFNELVLKQLCRAGGIQLLGRLSLQCNLG